MAKQKFSYKNWNYEFDSDGSDIDSIFKITPFPRIPIPSTLNKYYSLSDYSIDALTNSYLYGTSIFDLNDPFDSMNLFLDIDGVNDEQIIAFYRNFLGEKEILPYIVELRGKFLIEYTAILASKYGIISFSETCIDVSMWAYYASSHQGFAIRMKSKLINSNLAGPFPINYRTEWDKIDYNKGPGVSFLYMTNIKSKSWEKEKEWRYVALGNSMAIPRTTMDTASYQNNRKFYYPIESIDKVILGFKFIEGIVQKKVNNEIYLEIDCNSEINRYKQKVLEHITANKLKSSYIDLKNRSKKFELEERSIEILKINKTEYTIKFTK